MKKLLKAFFQSNSGQSFLAGLAAFYIRLVYYTTRWQKVGFEIPIRYLDQNKPFITVFWHAKLFMLAYAWPSIKPFYMLISYHHDGKLISRTVGHFGIQTIFGSTNRGGIHALKNIFSQLKQGNVIGITPDGPRGPRHSIAKGLLHIAHKANVDIIPVSYATTHGKFFRSWDRFFLPFPFGKGLLAWGDPIKEPQTFKLSSLEKSLEKHLKELDDTLNKKCGWTC